MAADLGAVAKQRKIKYFLISYVDLFGGLRAKLVPARAIGEMQRAGAGFAGFATWLDMTPADSDMFAVPDADSLTILPWKPEVGWLAADLMMDGKPVSHSPRCVLKQQIEKAAKLGYRMKTGVECEFFLTTPDGKAVGDERDTQSKPCYDQSALMRRYEVITLPFQDLLGFCHSLDLLHELGIASIQRHLATIGKPVLEWADDSREDWYDIRVFDAFGNEVWTSLMLPGVSGSDTVTLQYEGPLDPGMYYQFRVTSWRQLPPDRDGGVLRIVEPEGPVRVAWQTAPANPVLRGEPDLQPGRVGREQRAEDLEHLPIAAGSFVRFSVTADVVGGMPLPSLRELRLVDR